jgi:hypothetical protein
MLFSADHIKTFHKYILKFKQFQCNHSMSKCLWKREAWIERKALEVWCSNCNAAYVLTQLSKNTMLCSRSRLFPLLQHFCLLREAEREDKFNIPLLQTALAGIEHGPSSPTIYWLSYPDSRNSAGSIVTNYGLDDRLVGVRVHVRSRIFSSSRRPDRLWGPPSFLFNGYRGLLPRE